MKIPSRNQTLKDLSKIRLRYKSLNEHTKGCNLFKKIFKCGAMLLKESQDNPKPLGKMVEENIDKLSPVFESISNLIDLGKRNKRA